MHDRFGIGAAHAAEVMSQAVSRQVSHTVPACSREVPSAWKRPFTRPRFIRP